jgi:hypothetical protein
MTKYNETPAGDALRALMTGGLWFMEAPDNVSFPYGVFTWNGSNIDEIAGDRTNAIEIANITVSLFDKNDDGAVRIFNIVQQFIELYDWATLTYPAGEYTNLEMQRTSATNRGKIDNIWNVDLDYDVWYQH